MPELKCVFRFDVFPNRYYQILLLFWKYNIVYQIWSDIIEILKAPYFRAGEAHKCHRQKFTRKYKKLSFLSEPGVPGVRSMGPVVTKYVTFLASQDALEVMLFTFSLLTDWLDVSSDLTDVTLVSEDTF